MFVLPRVTVQSLMENGMSRHWTLALAAVALLAGCDEGGLGRDWHRLDPPVAAADFTLPTLDGRTLALSQLRGKVVLVEFWATWCGPCRYSMPSLEKIYREYRGRGMEVLLVNEGEDAETIIRWAKARFTAPILLDQDGRVGNQYGVTGIPRLLVIDPQGQVLYDHAGYGGGLERSLRVILDELLAAPAVA